MRRAALRLWHLGAVMALLFGAGVAAAQDDVRFPSANYDNFRALAVGTSSGAVTVPGILAFPAQGREPFAAIVVAESCGGYRQSDEGWHADRFREAGYATLVFSSVRARGVAMYCTGNPPAPWASLVADAYAALRFLAANPRIDAKRIAIAGFSMGGELAHLTALSALRPPGLPADLTYAAHVAFYPPGVFGAVAQQGAYAGPVLWLHGDKEELVPAAKIAAYFDYWAKSGAPFPVRRIDYPGAYHSWTDPIFTPVRWFGTFASAKACPFLLLDAHGATRLLIDGAAKPVDPAIWPACTRSNPGYSQGFDEAIRARSLSDALAFLKQSLG